MLFNVNVTWLFQVHDDDDDDIIFDISQLELNTTEDDISNIGKEIFQLKINEGSSKTVTFLFCFPFVLQNEKKSQLSFS
jgi:hypothetical protein